MNHYQSDYWQMELPAGWVSEPVDESVSFYNPNGTGTLLVTTIREEAQIDDDYLASLAQEHINAGAELYEVEYGSFAGVTCCYDADGEYWCEWYLSSDNILLFVTYNCDKELEGEEDDVVEGMLESLSQRQLVDLH